MIASLVETCKINDVEPQSYLADVIGRIVNGHPQSRIDELLPWAYPAAPALLPSRNRHHKAALTGCSLYICPAGKTLTCSGTLVNDGATLLYRASKYDCDA